MNLLEMFKVVPRAALRSVGAYSSYYLRRYGYLRDMNWFRSYDLGRVIGPGDEPLPWITFPCIHFLENRIGPEMSVFEYGSGGSTLWWSKRVAKIVAVEHLPEWYDKLRADLPPNVEVLLVQKDRDGHYCRAAAETGERFDIIVIDGRDRVNCVKQSLCALKDDGVILWDNTDRERYQEGFDWLTQRDFRRLDFFGMGPRAVEGWPTSVFYREDNCLGL